MGIMSSIFGERPSAPQTGGFTTGAEIPKELAPYYKDILGKSQALYDDSVSQGYQPYTGPSLAEFTPEQQQAFTGIAGLQGQQAPIYQEAMGMTRDSAAPITTEQIEEYMNPYQQAVVDVEKREATKQYQSQVQPQLAAQAARIQPFGGSRQAILEGMAADTQQRLLGDIQAKGSAQAYQDSVNLINQQRMQQGQAAGQLATMGSNQFKSQLGELGALQTIGEEKQQLSQQALNEAYGQYLKEQEYPYQQLGRYQSVVTGAPIQQTQYVPPTPPGPSVGQQLLGGAATMLGTYGAFGGKMPSLFGGAAGAKTGGGIGDLPVIKRQQNGPVNEWNMYNSATGYDARNKKRDLERAERERKEKELKRINNLNSKGIWGGPIVDDQQYNQKFYSPSTDKYTEDKNSSYLKYLMENFEGGPEFNYPWQKDKYLEDKPNVNQEKTYFRNPEDNPIWQEDNRGGITNYLKNKYNSFQEYRQNINDKINEGKRMAAEKGRIDAEEQNINPFSNKNRPANYTEQQDVRPDSPFMQDINKLKERGYEFIGDTADVLEKGQNWWASNLNKIIQVGENYFLKPGEKIDFRYKINEEGTARKNIREGKNLPPINIAESSEAGAERIRALSNDRKPGWNEGIIVEAEKIIEDPSIITDNNAVNTLKELYIKMAKGVGALPELDNKATEKKTENLLENPVSNKKIIITDEKVNDNITEINTNNTKTDKVIIKNEDKVKDAAIDYNNLITKKDKGDKVPKSKLAGAQDTYLAAVKKMNAGLDKKDALIGKAQQESFWAFVARVGANISKGAAISSAVADELPQAMKDRQSLIQAKSDLADKKLAGKVDVAKAGLDVESSRTSARIATEREKQRRIEAATDDYINFIRAKNTGSNKNKKFTAPSTIVTDYFEGVAEEVLGRIAKGDVAYSTYFSPDDQINIEGVSNEKDLNQAFKLLSKNEDFLNDLATVGANYTSDEEDFINNNFKADAIKQVLKSNNYVFTKENGIFGIKKRITRR